MVRNSLYCNNSLAISDEMWFLTADPVVGKPMIFAELPKWKICGCFFKKHHWHEQVQFFDIHRGFVSLFAPRRWPSSPSSHCSMSSWSSNSAEFRSFLADHMHTRSWTNYKLSFLRLFCWRSQEYPFLRGRVECSIVFFIGACKSFLARFHALAAGTSLLSFQSLHGTCPQIS